MQTLYLIPGAKLKSIKSGIDLSGVYFNIEVKHDDVSGTISATITDGHILFEPVLYRELNIDWVPPRINRFKLAAGGDIDFDIEVMVEAEIDVSLIDEKIRIFLMIIGPIPIGPVPMFIEYSIDQNFKAGISMSGDVTFGFESSFDAQFGASYNRLDNPKWNSILDVESSLKQKPFNFNFKANAYAQFGIGPRLDATIVGFKQFH